MSLSVLEASFDLVGHVLGHGEQLTSDVVRDSKAVASEAAAFYSATTRGFSDAKRATPRFLRIVSEAGRIAASYRLHESAAPHMSPELRQRRMNRVHAANARRVYGLCIELGGGVLKLGQFLSCRMDLLPDAWVQALSGLQDNVPAQPFTEIAPYVEVELGAPLDTLFATFDPEPLAAASLAQVHAATLLDGTAVAVKVQRPGIDEIIETDIAAIRVAAGMLRGLLPEMDMETITRQLGVSLIEELDFQKEAANALELATCFKDDDRVIVPVPRPALSTGRILTMDRLNGRRITEFLDAEPGQRDTVLEVLIDCFCAQVLRHGVLHSDPHPGNFLVVDGPKGPRLALLDFGCVQRFPSEVRRAYAGLASAIVSRDFMRVAELLDVMGFQSADDKPDSLITFAQMFLEAFSEDLAGGLDSIDARAQLEKAMAMARTNPIVRIPQDFVMLGRVFGALGGLLMHYKPKINLFLILAPHLSHAMSTRAPHSRPEDGGPAARTA